MGKPFPVPSETERTTSLKYKEQCGVCNAPLTYQPEAVSLQCTTCGTTHDTNIFCPEKHYICDACHKRETVAVLREVVETSRSRDPVEMFEAVVSHPSVPMHGPEHHAIVPAVIIAAVRNAGYSVPRKAIEQAITRGSKVPGGWCGLHGACGAAIGAGTAMSVLTEATPLTGRDRSLAMEATSLALDRMLDEHPRCCKRAGRKALEAAIDFLRDRMGITLEAGESLPCRYPDRNKECVKTECAYYAGV